MAVDFKPDVGRAWLVLACAFFAEGIIVDGIGVRSKF